MAPLERTDQPAIPLQVREAPRVPAPQRCLSTPHPPTVTAHCTRLAQSLSRAVGSIDLPVRRAVRARWDPRRDHREGRPGLSRAGAGG